MRKKYQVDLIFLYIHTLQFGEAWLTNIHSSIGRTSILGIYTKNARPNKRVLYYSITRVHSPLIGCPRISLSLEIAMLVFSDTMTKGGGQHVFRFLICAFASEL